MKIATEKPLCAVAEWLLLTVVLVAAVQLIYGGVMLPDPDPPHAYQRWDAVMGVGWLWLCGCAMYGLATRSRSGAS